jgi:hypothetical protein
MPKPAGRPPKSVTLMLFDLDTHDLRQIRPNLYRASAGSTSVPSARFVSLGQGSVTISARVR